MRSLLSYLSLALLLLAGCKAGQPGDFESKVVQTVKQQVTIGGKDDKNPTPDDEPSWKLGKEHFQHHCQICHGMDGQNTGVPFASKMDPPVADLSSKDVQEYTDGQLKWIIENGISPSGMPGWKGILSDQEMWHMVRFLRKLPAKGSEGVPPVFQHEAEEHGAAQRSGAKPHSHAPDAPPHKH